MAERSDRPVDMVSKSICCSLLASMSCCQVALMTQLHPLSVCPLNGVALKILHMDGEAQLRFHLRPVPSYKGTFDLTDRVTFLLEPNHPPPNLCSDFRGLLPHHSRHDSLRLAYLTPSRSDGRKISSWKDEVRIHRPRRRKTISRPAKKRPRPSYLPPGDR